MLRHIGWFTAIILYLLVWWTILFAVLPIGARPKVEPDAQTGWRGVPQQPRMGRKAVITSLVALVIWGGLLGVINSDWLSFRHGWLAMPTD